jgi:hypothetical protein
MKVGRVRGVVLEAEGAESEGENQRVLNLRDRYGGGGVGAEKRRGGVGGGE